MSSESSTETLIAWAGGSRATLAIVFTDVVNSTALGERLGDEKMNAIWSTHFSQSHKLITEFRGRPIKSLGDGDMAVFRTVEDALDFVLALKADPGLWAIPLRACIHVGPVEVLENDIRGREVNFAARVGSANKGAQVWISNAARQHIISLRADRHKGLRWQDHVGIQLKGFDGEYQLCSLIEDEKDELWKSPSNDPPVVHDVRIKPFVEPIRADKRFIQKSLPRRRQRFLGSIFISVAVVAVAVGTAAWFLLNQSAIVRPLKPGDTFSDCKNCPTMIVVPSGTFLMGSSMKEDQSAFELPTHEVRLSKSFAVGKFEVTNNQYADFLTSMLQSGNFDQRNVATSREDTNSPLLFHVRFISVAAGWGNHPVTGLSWPGAKAYVQWLSSQTGVEYRILTEAEWEYAERAGTQTKYYFGDDDLQLCEYGNVPDRTHQEANPSWSAIRCTDGYAETAPIGKFRPNSFGIYDMVGNALEWVEDCWHKDYSGAPTDGSAWISGGDCEKRVARGGSWEVFRMSGSGTRYVGDANTRGKTMGFRVGIATI
jgi:formylglycine-generating enzyme required for sulfatase activity/class 3 adenylate cyclase